MLPLIVLGVIVLIAVVRLVWLFVRPIFVTFYQMKNIPEFPKHLPLAGVTMLIANLNFYGEMFDYFQIISRKCPKISKSSFINQPIVMLNCPEYIETLMSSVNHIKKGFEYHALESWLRDGLLISFGSKWHKRRKLLTPTFHFKILEKCINSLNNNSLKLVRNLLATDGKPTDVEDHVKLYTLDVICETAMGVHLNSQDNQSGEYVQAIKRITEIVPQRLIQPLLHNDWLFAMSSLGREFKKNIQILHGFTEQVIADRRTTYNNVNIASAEDSGAYNNKKAFLDCLIALDVANPGFLTAEDIREEVDTFMFEGHDTTSTAIAFALYLLATYPNEQEKAAAEQFQIFGSDTRVATIHDLYSMTYLELIIKETLRLFPSVPYISRMLTQDLVFQDGVTVPAGVNAIVVPYILHRNEELWDSPLEFVPERFTETRHPFSYIPFSAGPRNCIGPDESTLSVESLAEILQVGFYRLQTRLIPPPSYYIVGQKFAMLELKSALSTVLRHCKLESVTGEEKLKLAPLVILRSETPLKVRVIPRG